MPVLPFDCNDFHFRASSQVILGSITPPHIFSRHLSIVKKMQPLSLHHVHSAQVVWSRVHLRPTDSLGQSSRLAHPQQQVPVARPKMTSKLMYGAGPDCFFPVKRLTHIRSSGFPSPPRSPCSPVQPTRYRTCRYAVHKCTSSLLIPHGRQPGDLDLPVRDTCFELGRVDFDGHDAPSRSGDCV